MKRWVLEAAVGVGQVNRKPDVLIVQRLLNRSRQDDPVTPALAEDGVFGPLTKARLVTFQSSIVHMASSDAVVQSNGPTARALAGFAPPSSPQSLPRPPAHGTATPRVEPRDALAAALMQRAARPKAGFKTAWINRALPAATSVKHNWGVPIAVTIAQGALESNWGRHAPSNVFFGVKGKAPDGRSAKLATHEVTNGVRHGETDGFRAYDTLEASADDYGRFLATNHRYAHAFAYRDDPDRFIHLVALAGYATDPNYEQKIKSIMAANGLKDCDTKLGGRRIYNDAVSVGVVA